MELTDTITRFDRLCGGPPTEVATCTLCPRTTRPYYNKHEATAAIAAHYQLHHGDAFTSFTGEEKINVTGVMRRA